MIFIQGNKYVEGGYLINIDSIVMLFDKVVIHDELYIELLNDGKNIALIFGDNMIGALVEMNDFGIKVEVNNTVKVEMVKSKDIIAFHKKLKEQGE